MSISFISMYQISAGTVKYFTPLKTNTIHKIPQLLPFVQNYTIEAILHYCAMWTSFETHLGYYKWGCRSTLWWKGWQCVFDCPWPPSSPARCDWEGAMGRLCQRLSCQQLRYSALWWQFSFSCLTSGTLPEMDTGQFLSLDIGYPKKKAASLPTNLAIYGSLKNRGKSSWDKLYSTWKSVQNPHNRESFSLSCCLNQATLVSFSVLKKMRMSSFIRLEKQSSKQECNWIATGLKSQSQRLYS